MSRATAKHIGQAGFSRNGAFHGALNHRTVAQGIAEGHAQFDHIRTRVNGGERDGARRLARGVAGGEVHHQARFVIESNRHQSSSALLAP